MPFDPLGDDATMRRVVAAIVIIWVMVLFTAEVIFDAIGAIRHYSHTPPDYFVQICTGTVFSMVLVLGVSTTAAIRAYLDAKSKKGP